MKYAVSVEKRMYSTGIVTVDCENEDRAIELVENQITNGDLQTADIEWGEPAYEDFTFEATGDVEQLSMTP